MTISDLRSRIADRLLIAGCVIVLAGCNQTRVAEAPTTETPAIDVVELSATAARDRMASGQLTSEALTKAYLDRIAKIDDAGPKLDSVIEINPRAAADLIIKNDPRLDGETSSGGTGSLRIEV
jgi:amidase